MITLADVAPTKVSLTKNLISDQTETSTSKVSGSAAFNATYGYGIASAATIVVLAHAGGFNDQRITAVMRYRTPTANGAENMGVVGRFQTFDNATYQTYYIARCNAGVAKLTRVNGGTFTNISTGTFALLQDVDVTIILTMNGSAISASFAASGLTTVNLSGTDSSITTGGMMGFRTQSQVGYCSSFTAEQL